MKPLLTALALLALTGPAVAQTQPQDPPLPTPTAPAPPYGDPITLEQAQTLVDQAIEAGRARGLRLAIAVVEPNGALVAFGRMDDVQYGSIAVAQAKARTAALFRTPTASLEQRVLDGRTVILSLPDMTPVAGGVPIVRQGRIVGAIGVSGATSAQDAEVALAALNGG